jgi:saccharopine dehydrogenase (NAD+, L-lysine-forming)
MAEASRQTVLVLGGYGQTGRRVVTWLAGRNPDLRIVVAGRDGDRAARVATALDPTRSGRVVPAIVDAGDPISVRAGLAGVDLLVNTASAPEHARSLIRAALEAGTDWCDTQVARPQSQVLRDESARIAAAGRCFVTQAGFHPGVPAALVRWAAAQVDVLTEAWTAGFIRQRGGFPPSSAMGELFDEFRDYRAEVFSAGTWREVGWLGFGEMPMVDFAFGLGRARTYPYDLDELHALPDLMPGLRRLGFGVAGFDPVTDWVVTPAIVAGAHLSRRTYPGLARVLAWSTRTFGRPPFGVAVQCDAAGVRAGEPVALRVALGHQDAYELTAIPVVCMIEQLLDGSARSPGLHLMGQLVDPDRLLAECGAMGVNVLAGESPGAQRL